MPRCNSGSLKEHVKDCWNTVPVTACCTEQNGVSLNVVNVWLEHLTSASIASQAPQSVVNGFSQLIDQAISPRVDDLLWQ